MKLVKFYLGVSAGLYVVCVGLLAAFRAAGLIQVLSTPEMFYGPAITIVSSWIIFSIIFAITQGLSRRKKREKS